MFCKILLCINGSDSSGFGINIWSLIITGYFHSLGDKHWSSYFDWQFLPQFRHLKQLETWKDLYSKQFFLQFQRKLKGQVKKLLTIHNSMLKIVLNCLQVRQAEVTWPPYSCPSNAYAPKSQSRSAWLAQMDKGVCSLAVYQSSFDWAVMGYH